jgi:hypothetical protein
MKIKDEKSKKKIINGKIKVSLQLFKEVNKFSKMKSEGR